MKEKGYRARRVYDTLRVAFAPAFIGSRVPHRRKRFINSRVAISRQYRFVYCRQSKAANSTIAVALHQHELALPSTDTEDEARVGLNATEEGGYESSSIAKPENAPRGAVLAAKRALKRESLVNQSREQLKEIAESYFIFTFVRNPYSRLLSAYLDKIAPPARAEDGRRRHVCRVRGLAEHETVPFEEFVAYLEQGNLYQDPHWIPQVGMIPYHLFRPSFVGRVECINEDLPEVLRRIFGECRWQPGGRDGMQHATGAGEKLRAYYNHELAERVHALYCADFSEFGYEAGLEL